MKWIVQEFLNNNSNVVRILTALENTNTDYLLIRLNRDSSLTVLDKESKLPFDDSDEMLIKFIKDADVMVYGSKAFAKVAEQLRLSPGSFWNKNFEFEVFKKALGDDLLNAEFEIGELWDLSPKWTPFFIRPTGNTKLFTGMVVDERNFSLWKNREIRGNSPYDGQPLMISPIQEIEAEYRFFVVNQKIVTASSYKVENQINESIVPNNDLMYYTQGIINKLPLANAFVVDIAVTQNGYKVVEYNNLNTSGLYGCNEFALVNALNELSNNNDWRK